MRDDLPVQMIEDIEGAYASQNRLLCNNHYGRRRRGSQPLLVMASLS